MKWCKICNTCKPVSAFNKNLAKKDGLQSNCRECSNNHSKSHYNRNKSYYSGRNKQRKQEIILLIQKAKEGKSCQDCGKFFPSYVMDFDHRDPTQKKWGLAGARRHMPSDEEVLKEIDKCDLVCANCHRIRTFTRESTSGSSPLSLKQVIVGSNPTSRTNFRPLSSTVEQLFCKQ